MPSLLQYALYTSLVLVTVGCSEADPTPGEGSGGSSLTAGGTSTSGAGGLSASGAPAAGGVSAAGTGGSATGVTGGSATAGTGGGSGGASGGSGGASGGSGGASGGSGGNGGVAGLGGTTSAGGSGGAETAPGCGNSAAPKGPRTLTIQVGGKSRTYLLFVPNGYDPKKSIPLIFAWHGSGGDGEEVRRYFRLEAATGDGAIIVYPDGLNGAWDLAAEGVDVKFFDAMLTATSKDYCVDPARVFTTGYSFGGMMSHALACSRGSKLGALAPTAGSFRGGSSGCATPVPTWIAHASNDNVVSYSSAQAARDVWLKTNGCGTTTTPTSPSPCVSHECSKAPVQWCVHKEGHEWPSFASKAMWAFFSSL